MQRFCVRKETNIMLCFWVVLLQYGRGIEPGRASQGGRASESKAKGVRASEGKAG